MREKLPAPVMKLALVPGLELERLQPQLPQQEFCCRYYPLCSHVQRRWPSLLTGEGS
jgi:hypothetical protein